MKNNAFEAIIGIMRDAGCSEADINRAGTLYDAGLEEEILKILRKCRCDALEELHTSQRRVDCLDHLIRSAERAGAR